MQKSKKLYKKSKNIHKKRRKRRLFIPGFIRKMYQMS